jgi:hypothetical protein
MTGAVAGFLLATTASAAPAPPTRPSLAPADCFRSRDWQGWKSPSPDVLYLRVRGDVYRVDLMGRGGQPLEGPGKLIITETRGSDRICSPIDLDIRLGDTIGFSTPLFPTGIRKLSPAEVAALPSDQRP